MADRAMSGWARDTGILLVSQGSALVVVWALSILIARQLGPAEFGVFTACLGGAIGVAVLMEFGLGRWLLRELSALFIEAGPEGFGFQASALLAPSRVIWLAFASTLIAAVTAVALLAGFSGSVATALILLVAYTAVASLATLLETVFRAQRRVGVVALVTIVEKIVLAAGVATVLTIQVRIEFLATAYLVAGVARLTFDGFLLARMGIQFWDVSATAVRRTLRAALPFFLTASSFTLLTRIDPVVIAASSTVVAGYYGVGERVLSVLLFVPITGSTTLFPHVSGAAAASRSGMQITGVLAGISALLGLCLVVAAPTLVPILYGGRFTESVVLVQLMVAALPAIAIVNGLTVILLARRRERLATSLNLSMMLLGSAGLAVGTALAGSQGAGIAYLLRAWGLCAVLIAVTLFTGRRSRRPLSAKLD